MVIQFIQADSATSSEKSLYSDAHDNCHCVIVYNLDTGSAHMLHVWEAAWEGLSIEQQQKLDEWLQDPGRKVAVRITGRGSWIDDNFTKKQMADRGIEYINDIEVSNKMGEYWGVLFDPKTKEATVTLDKTGEVLYKSRLFSQHGHRAVAVEERSSAHSTRMGI